MSETTSQLSEQKTRKPKTTNKPVTERKPRRTPRETQDLTNLIDWCQKLDFVAKPSIHVNGSAFQNLSILTVDFGTPLEQQRLSDEQEVELARLMTFASNEVLGRDRSSNVAVNNELREGIWWTSVRTD